MNSTPTTSREWTIRAHRAVYELPDTLHVTFSGPTTLEDTKEALKMYEEAAKERPYYLLADIKHSSLDSASRKYLADHLRPEWFRGVVYVGAGLPLKIVTKALTVMVLFNAPAPYEVHFADSVEEARAVIAGLRAKAEGAPAAS